MKDRLEDFVKNHSEEFDLFEPSPEMWKGIEKKIEKPRRLNWKLYMSRAAAVAAIFLVSLIVTRNFFPSDRQIKIRKEAQVNIPELNEAEMYYSGIISAKLEEVKPYLANYPGIEDELNHDLSELDSIYASLKEDLKEDVANQEVLEAMIQNYRLRIDILEEMVSFLTEDDNERQLNDPEYEL